MLGAVAIAGLEVERELGRGSFSVAYSARRGGQNCVLKLPLSDNEEIRIRFRREAAAIAGVRHASIPGVIELGETDVGPFLVLERVYGSTLLERLRTAPTGLSEREVLQIGRGLASALAEVHRRGFLHRDIKPANILLHPNGEPALIDFGLTASVGDSEESDPVGTLHYAAPEQTGMIKRAVDPRADLYSLGSVLFECATGRPLLVADGSGDVLWKQVSLPVPLVRERRTGFSPALARIIETLVARDPDDRYATAARLLADLDAVPALDRRFADTGELELNLGTVAEVLGAEDGALTRERELAILQRAWRGSKRGPHLVLVEAPTGFGRSHLVRAFAHDVEREGGLVLVGACDRDTQEFIAPLRRAIDALLQRISRMPPRERGPFDAKIRAAVPARGAQLLEHLSALLVAYLPETPETPEGLPSSRDAFDEAVSHFLLGLAQQFGGLLLVLDDVHWLDDAAAQFLRHFARALNSDSPVLLVATARTDPGAPTGLERFLAALGSHPLERVVLEPLGPADVARVIAGHLGSEVDEAFAQQVAAHTGGSPLGVHQYVRALIDEGLLRPAGGRWAARGGQRLLVPRAVTELIERRVQRLQPATREALEQGAVLGSRFGLDHLQRCWPGTDGSLRAALEDAVSAHLLVAARGGFEFAHERVREQVLARLAPEALNELHARAARALEACLAADPGLIFALARHCAAAGPSFDPRRTYETNRTAGLSALETWAETEAYTYLRAALSAAAVAGITADVKVHEGLGDVAGRIGRSDESIEHLSVALELSHDPIRRALLRSRRARALVQQRADFDRAWNDALEAFRELGVNTSGATLSGWAATLWDWVRGLVLSLLPVRRADQVAPREREYYATLAELYERGAPLAYMSNRRALVVQFGLRSFYVGYRQGLSRGLARCIVNLSLGMGIGGLRRAARSWSARGIAMAQRLNDPATLAYATLGKSWVLLFGGDVIEAEKVARECLKNQRAWLDAEDYLRGCSSLAGDFLARGRARDVIAYTEQARAATREFGWAASVAQLRYSYNPAGSLAMLGLFAQARAALDEFSGSSSLFTQDRIFVAQLLHQRLLVHLEMGEEAQLDEALRDSERFLEGPTPSSSHVRQLQVLRAYVRLSRLERASDADRAALRQAFERELEPLRGHTGFVVMVGHTRVLEAASCISRGKFSEAEKLLDEAGRLAERCDAPWISFEMSRQRARLLLARDQSPSARWHAQHAHALAVDQGWTPRAARLRAEFKLELAVPLPAPARSADSSTPRAGRAHLQTQRKLDALIEIHRACAQVVDPTEQARVVITTSVRLLGAERGILFTLDETETLLPHVACDAAGNRLTLELDYSTRVLETVRSTRRPVVLNGPEDAASLGSQSAVVGKLRSVAASPLMLNDRFIGVLYFDTRLATGVLTAGDVEVVETIAHHLAIRLENARTTSLEVQLATERRQRELADELSAFAARLAGSVDETAVATHLMDALAAATRFGAAVVVLGLFDKLPRRAAQRGVERSDQHWESAALELESALGGRRVVELEPVTAHALGLPPRGGRVAALRSNRGLEGFVALVDGEKSSGTHEVEVLQAFVAQAGLALDVARLFAQTRAMATQDELTRVLNRRGFWASVQDELARCRRRGALVGVLALDVDHFKRINDTWGHPAGDAVLRELARRWAGALRKGDLLGRIGGEEFAVLLPDVDRAETLGIIAERLRALTEDTPVTVDGGRALSATVSIGVTSSASGEAIEALLHEADAALYEAKRSGRNRCVVRHRGEGPVER